jgi:hypothetical protein
VIGAKTVIVVACVATFAWSPHVLAEKSTPEFASGATRPRSIALLPVEAVVSRARVVETEALVDDGLVYGEMFNAQVEAALNEKGYKVVVVDPDRINSDAQLQEYVVDANRGFDDMMAKYKPKKLETRALNAGDSVRLLADRLGVDAIAFATLNMTITAAGKALVAGFLGGSTSGTSSNLAIVNGDNGDLEAFFFGVAIVTPGEKTDQEMENYVATVAERTTNKMPAADPSSRIDVATSDEQTLDEVESLLKR